MNPFVLPPRDRLKHWKEFRNNLATLSDPEKLEAVAKYFSMAPLSNIAYDVETPSDWPTPWEMIEKGDWCRNSVAIGMEFTLRLAGFSAERMSLQFMRDWDISQATMVVNIDDAYLLNYTVGIVERYPDTRHDIVNAVRYTGKNYQTAAR